MTAKRLFFTKGENEMTYKTVYNHRAVAEYFNINRPVKCPVKALQQR